MQLPAQAWREPFRLAVPVLHDRDVWVVFGPGSFADVPDEVRRLGQRALLITGRHEGSAADLVTAGLGNSLVGQIREVAPHVPVGVAAEAGAHARDVRADILITIGGGSATGLAKAITLQTGLPIVAVPTTYAGSEMTPIWGLTGRNAKTTGRDAQVLPRTVIYDPALTISLPADVTAASGMNALAHAIEALYAPDVTAELAEVAESAIGALINALPFAVARSDDLDARSSALYGAWLAGWTLGSTTMGLHHKLAHVLGGTFRLPHAGVHSALLPQVAAYNAPSAGPRFIGAARAIRVAGPGYVGEALFDFAHRIAAPTSLARLGMRPGAIDQVAAAVAASDVANPRPITEADLVRVLRFAYEGTRP